MRFTYRAAGPIAAAVVLTLVCACSRTQQDWRVAQQADTAGSYNVFVQRHPDSELAGVARQRIAQLTEETAWQQATRANTAGAYRDYLMKYPGGSWSQDARIRMESRSLAALPPPAAAPTPPGAADPQPAPAPALEQPVSGAPLAAAPTPSQTPVQTAKPASTAHASPGGSAVQLGAFSSAANARNAWSQLSSRFRTELRGLTPVVLPVSSSGRQLYRLEARVADPAAARRLCRQLAQHSQDCLPAS
jgi:cell division septation protein DedD